VLRVDGSRLSFTVVQADSVTKATIASIGIISFFMFYFLVDLLFCSGACGCAGGVRSGFPLARAGGQHHKSNDGKQWND